MKKIKLQDGYFYLPENNLIVNEETLTNFDLFLDNNKISYDKFSVNNDFLNRQIKNLKQIIFCVTEQCNLRCAYCVFNNNYQHERSFSEKNLTFEIAQKALTYIYGIVGQRIDKNFAISFFGGEPFVNFKLIKDIVSYSKELFTGWQLKFNATTNATMFKDEIIDYLIAENFQILVSLDGPQKNHDAKRIFKDGRGTFNTVWNNLKRIREKCLDYYEQNISFNIVHSFDQPIIDIFHFFNKTDIISKQRVNYCQVIVKKTDYYEKYRYDEEIIREEFRTLFRIIKDKCKRSIELQPIEKAIYRNFFTNKEFNTKPKNIFFGTCFFDTRLFVDADGQFHLCEGINNKLSIGNVWSGFDFDFMLKIVMQYENIRKNYCTNCDINYLCKPCYVVFAADGSLQFDENFCSHIKSTKIMNLQRIINFEEEMLTETDADEAKIFHFHQFITIEKGLINSAIVDFMHGDIYHVPTKIINHFENHEYEQITEFLKEAQELKLIIQVKKNTWIPRQLLCVEDIKKLDEIGRNQIILCIEEGVDIPLLQQKVAHFQIRRIIFYGSTSIDNIFPNTEIIYETLDFEKCSKLSIIKKDDFIKTDEEFYKFNHVCNNCWGHKVAITKDNKIRPCIFSTIIIDDIINLNKPETFAQIKSNWYITKDNVENCKECELKYFCVDCREIAQRENHGNLYAPNPNCKYIPKLGVWQDE